MPDGLEIDPVIEPDMGCGHRPHPAPGHYVRLNKGLEANFATAEEPNSDDNTLPEGALFAAIGSMCYDLLLCLPYADRPYFFYETPDVIMTSL